MSIIYKASGDYLSVVSSKLVESLYLNSELADVIFLFDAKDGDVSVPAQKFHLSAGSAVFCSMFKNAWKDKTEIKIWDVSVSAFKEFLQFFYFGEVRLTMENIVEVLNLGKKYDLPGCSVACGKFLRDRLTIDNACLFYSLALTYDQVELRRACEIFIGLKSKAVFKSSGFLACDQQILDEILKLNYLSCTEIDLFEACMNWIKVTTGEKLITKELIESTLGKSFHNIRFGSMSLKEFADIIPNYGHAISFIEQQEIIQMIAKEDYKPKIFSGNRQKRQNVDLLKEKTRIIGSRHLLKMQSFSIKNIETTKFTTNEILLLSAFGCNAVFEFKDNKLSILKEKLSGKITMTEYGTNERNALFSTNIELNSKGVSIALPKPVLCRPGFVYEIRMEQETSGLIHAMPSKAQIQLTNDIIIKFHDEPICANQPEINRGMVSNFAFYTV